MVIKYKILKALGYKPYRYVQVSSSWDGTPPYTYWSELKMIKGVKVKSVKFRHVADADDLRDIVMQDFYGKVSEES